MKKERFKIREISWKNKEGKLLTVGGYIIILDYKLQEEVFLTKSKTQNQYIEFLKNLPKPKPEPYKSVWNEFK
jgi:hypothetical protein